MFDKPLDYRLTAWARHRARINISKQPCDETWEFWKSAPFIAYNRRVDPFNRRSWPTPWEIIKENQYDDFTKALMIAWSLKLTEKFKNSKIEIRTLVDRNKNLVYNVAYVDEKQAINFSDLGPISVNNIPNSLIIENLIELDLPR